MKLLVINGPNLNLIGSREPDVYGRTGYDELMERVKRFARENGAEADAVQFNDESGIIDAIHNADGNYAGIIINPGAYAHYSYAIHDAIKAVGVDAVEVHLSNIAAREEFRRISVTAPACVGQISGLGVEGYIAAVRYFMSRESGNV